MQLSHGEKRGNRTSSRQGVTEELLGERESKSSSVSDHLCKHDITEQIIFARKHSVIALPSDVRMRPRTAMLSRVT